MENNNPIKKIEAVLIKCGIDDRIIRDTVKKCIDDFETEIKGAYIAGQNQMMMSFNDNCESFFNKKYNQK